MLRFLENGWHVHGTIRTAEKGAKYPSLEAVLDRASFTYVEGFMNNDFTKATQGADAVVYIAR